MKKKSLMYVFRLRSRCGAEANIALNYSGFSKLFWRHGFHFATLLLTTSNILQKNLFRSFFVLEEIMFFSQFTPVLVHIFKG